MRSSAFHGNVLAGAAHGRATIMGRGSFCDIHTGVFLSALRMGSRGVGASEHRDRGKESKRACPLGRRPLEWRFACGDPGYGNFWSVSERG